MASKIHSWQHQSKESWLAQVLKDNPFTTKNDYTFHVEQNILADPFPFFTDLPPDACLNINSIIPSNWKCGTQIFLDDPNQTKSELQSALSNGIEYLTINVLRNHNSLQLEKIFENIHLDFIQTTWLFPDFFENYKETLDFIHKNSNIQHRLLCNTLNSISTNDFDTSQFSIYNLSLKSISDCLFLALKNISENKSQLKNILFKVYLNRDFLKNIYTIRALRIVSQNIKVLFELNTDIKIEARVPMEYLSFDQHNNLIQLSTLSSSAVLSGIDYLVSELPNIPLDPNEMKWKTAGYHLQQILKQEAKLNGLKDPLAGSYYLDNMSLKYAHELWKNLQEKIKE